MGYFPYATQDQWYYSATNTDPRALAAVGDATATVTGTQTVQGLSAAVFTKADATAAPSSIDNYYNIAGGGVTYLGNTDSSDTLTPKIVPYVQLLFPVATGTVSSITASNLSLGNDAQGHPIVLNMTQTIVNSDFEAIHVPAGSFANALKQVTTVNGTATDNGQSLAVTGTDTVWLVPGIGVVQESVVAAGGGTTRSESFALKGYRINGQRFGIQSPTTLTPQIGEQIADAAAVASDGVNFLVLTRQMLSTQQDWIAYFLGADGSLKATLNLAATSQPGVNANPPLSQAVAGYDGSNYLVVYTRVDTNPMTVNSVRISPTGTLLGPPVMLTTLSSTHPKSLALSFDGSRYLLLYPQDDGASGSGTYHLAGLFLDPATGQASATAFAIAAVAGNQLHPTLAFGGGTYLAAWDNPVWGAQTGLNAARISPGGAVDAVPLLVASEPLAAPGPGYQATNPSLSFDGSNFLVAYRDARNSSGGAGVSANRISPALVLVDGSAGTAGTVIASDKTANTGYVSTMFLGGAYWVFWENGTPAQILGARVSTGGAVITPGANGFQVITGGASPVVAANAHTAMLAWHASGAAPSGSNQPVFATVN